MTETAFTVPSVTYGMKAKKLLTAMGYSCVIKRLSVSSQKGCTHYIIVNTEQEKLIEILKRNNIKYGEILPKAVWT